MSRASNRSMNGELSRYKDVDSELDQISTDTVTDSDSDIDEQKTRPNAEILRWFRLLIKQLEFYVDVKTGKDKLIYSYKVNAIRKAYKSLAKYPDTIKAGKEVAHLKDVGAGTVKRIDEILTDGSLSEVKEADISGAHLEYVDELMKIFGIGRVKAYELYTDYDIKSVDDLRAAVKTGKVELPSAIIIGLKYYDQIDTKIPRSEMDEIYSKLILSGIDVDPEIDVRVCGSYRREVPWSGDVDVIVSHPNVHTKAEAENSDHMQNLIASLISSGFIVDSLTSPDSKTKYMGLCKISDRIRRIDIRFMAQESYYTAILYFTGSGDFNKRMRHTAKALGYKLNEYALIRLDDTKIMDVKSERDVFEYLNMEYLVPAERI